MANGGRVGHPPETSYYGVGYGNNINIGEVRYIGLVYLYDSYLMRILHVFALRLSFAGRLWLRRRVLPVEFAETRSTELILRNTASQLAPLSSPTLPL